MINTGTIGVTGGAGVTHGAIGKVFNILVVAGRLRMLGMGGRCRRETVTVVTRIARPGHKRRGVCVGLVASEAIGPLVVGNTFIGFIVVRGGRIGMTGGAKIITIDGVDFVVRIGAGQGGKDNRTVVIAGRS